MEIAESRIDAGNWDDHVAATDGYQLVVAGPGTGKTEFLIERVSRIIGSGLAARDQILALTFSRRAAGDLRMRIEESIGGSTTPIEATTFHSMALRLIETIGPGERPSPLTTPEQVALVRELLQTEDSSLWPITYQGVLGTAGFAEEVADFLMRCAERLLSPIDLAERAAQRADWKGLPGFYARYLDAMSERNRIDYGTLLVRAVEALGTEAGHAISNRYRYVLVDEYQDTSPAQAEMARLVAEPSGNLTVTGDPYQSIYSFRGAELRNVEDFQRSHPEVTRIVLERSFRVPKQIMESALRIVSSGDLPGAAGPVQPASHAGRVETYVFDQETAEAEWIANQVERAIHVDKTRPSGIAILMRSKREMLNEMSRALTRRGIPHNRPDRRLVDHPAVQVVADLVTIATLDTVQDSESNNPTIEAEINAAARRLILGPLVGATLGQLREMSVSRLHLNRWATIVGEQTKMGDLEQVLNDPAWATDRPAWDGFWHIWTEIEAMASVVGDPDRTDWRRAFASFSQVLDRQADRNPDLTLQEFFAYAEDESFEATPLIGHSSPTDSVVLTTLHQAKGLEFEEVFIANAVEGVFPDLRRSRRMLRPELLSPERTTNPAAQSQFQVQEEMRLAYTAMTRAKRRVVWTATDAGVDQGEQRPSRFLVAASDANSLSDIGRPSDVEHEPVTVAEAETSLRRMASDPGAGIPQRLAALSVLARSPKQAWSAERFAGVAEKGPDRPILGRTLTMSPSQADGYNRCPRLYAIDRRLRIGDPTSPYMHLGSLVHKALEDAERQIVGTDAPHNTLESALDALDQAWGQVDFGTPQQDKAWRERAEKIITKLYESWPKSGAVPIDLEREVSMEIDGVLWRGVIDRLEETSDGLRVVDYKTGAKPPTTEEAAVSIQLGFYALAVDASSDGPNVVAAELWFPAHQAKSLTIRSLDIRRLDEVEVAMRDVTAKVAAENWEPRVSSACTKCPYKSSCPAWPEGRGAFVA